jgi:mannose-1-phosphate guanylyltransferase/phosphomannomutase
MNKAVIMAGGFGTRLRPLTMDIPKPMVPLLNVPMMEHIVNLLKKHSINDIISLLYFQPEKITSYFKDGSNFGVNMQYVAAEADYGTAGSVKNAYKQLDSRFIIISGDVLTDFDISKAIDFHISKKSKATLLLTRVNQPLQYGIVIVDENGKITQFLEKPSWGQVFSDTINTGIYILEPEVLELIPYQEDFDFSKDLFPLMLEKGMPLYGYISEGYWRDIGNLEEYQSGQIDALHNRANIKEFKSDLVVGQNVTLPKNLKINGRVIIGDNSIIGENTTLTNTVIGSNCNLGRGCSLTGTTLWDNVKIGDFSSLSNDVVCNNTVIGNAVTINDNVYISSNCQIGDKAELHSFIKLWPNKKVQEGSQLFRSLVQEEKWQRDIFTDARISGISNIEISPEFASKLGSALGMAFGKGKAILASRDPNNVSRLIKRAIISGMQSTGIAIIDLQSTSIPQTRQELMSGDYDGGIHVRRSIRNADQTDIIIFSKDGRDISIAMSKKIERYFFGEDIARVHYEDVGKVKYPQRTNEHYISRYLKSIDVNKIKEKNFKLFIDYSYGLASTILPSIFGKLNVDTLSSHDFVDATRFHPDPTMDLKSADDTGKIMTSLNYELGFRIEAGAEKLAVIDERGKWLSPWRLLSIVTKLFLETNKHRPRYKIAVSIVASSEIEIIAKDYNVEVIRIKNSHAAMMEATSDNEVLFVGGIYGGFIFRDFLFASDGMFTIGKILEMLSITGYRISKLDSELPRRYNRNLKIDCPWEAKGLVMRKAMEHSQEKKRELVEGVKIYLDEESVLLIPEKETAHFSIVSESDNEFNADFLADKYSGIVQKWISEG